MRLVARPCVVLAAIAILTACGDDSVDEAPANNSANPRSDRPADGFFNFDRARITGARGLQCGESDTTLSVGFVLLDQEGDPLWPGDVVGSESVQVSDVSVAFQAASLGSQRRPELLRCATQCDTDQDCAEEAGRFCSDGYCSHDPDATAEDVHAVCTLAGFDLCGPLAQGDVESFQSQTFSVCRRACAEDADCADGRECIEGTDGGYCAIAPAGGRCADDSDCASGSCIDAEDPSGDHVCAAGTTVALQGELRFEPVPETVNLAIIMDDSGSLHGRGVSEADRTVKLDRATDPDLYRIAAMKGLLLNLTNGPYSERMQAAVWSFRGRDAVGVDLLTADTDGAADGFVSLEERGPAQSVLDALSQSSDYGRSNVFIAMEIVAGNLLESGRTGTTMLLFTDGPDDSFTVTPGQAPDAQIAARAEALDRAIEAVNEAGARVVIIHLDNNIGRPGLAATAPDPENALPHLLDAEGRTGPLDDYARIACETGGDYLYAADPRALPELLKGVEHSLLGAWRLEIAVAEADALPAGPHRLSAEFEFQLGERTKAASLGPYGYQTPYGLLGTDDNRLVVWSR